jgi:poly(A) polymerase
MDESFPFTGSLPPAADGAVEIVRTLVGAGHQALLAGGCVRDLLLGAEPQDYDVATDAPPARVGALFRATRHVGAQFGVVLVKRRRRWIEVATFRADGPYVDGRRPVQVTLSDARHDALRRDFTVNGMFLDPLAGRIVDYVGGRADLAARQIRAIGDPVARFDEDYLRLLRAVRFAARLGFPIEAATLAAIRTHAPTLAQVAAERVREELEKMLKHPARQEAWRLLHTCGLLPYLWPGAGWSDAQVRRVDTLLGRLPAAAPFKAALAILWADRRAGEIERNARAVTLSNEERENALWLVAQQGALDEPDAVPLAVLKRLMAHRAFATLVMLAQARYGDRADCAARRAVLAARLDAIAPADVQPPPLVTGDDLIGRGLTPGPVFRHLLDELYTRQLDGRLASREAALGALDELVRTTLPEAEDRR